METPICADVVELVDTRALGARALGREGSSPFIRTKYTGITETWCFYIGFAMFTVNLHDFYFIKSVGSVFQASAPS